MTSSASTVFCPLLLFAFFVGSAAAFYPAYKFENAKPKKAMDIIEVPTSVQQQQQQNSPLARGAFINPLFGYRFQSFEPSSSTPDNAQQQMVGPPLTSSEEEEQREDADSLEQSPASNNYDPPAKRNFYTHIWRDLQRMPAYRNHVRRLLAERHQPLLEKRDAADRMHAIRMG